MYSTDKIEFLYQYCPHSGLRIISDYKRPVLRIYFPLFWQRKRLIFNLKFWIWKFCLKYINWTVFTLQCSTLNRPIWPQNLMGLRLHLLLWKYQLSSINDEFITIEAFQIMDAKGGFHFLSLLYPVWLANTPVSSYPTRTFGKSDLIV